MSGEHLPVVDQLARQIVMRCKHFNGVRHSACDVGVTYTSVRSSDKALATYPCLTWGGKERPATCPKMSLYTEAEARAEAEETERRLQESTAKIARGECHVCGRHVEKREVHGSCAYASPCGHRIGQVDPDAPGGGRK